MEEREEQGAREQIEEMEDRAEQMEKRSGDLERDVQEARSDWSSKKGTESAPGAQDEEGAADTSSEDLRERRDDERGDGSDDE
jgi:hypothetical protein